MKREGINQKKPKEIQAQSAAEENKMEPLLDIEARSGYYRLVAELRGDTDSVRYAKGGEARRSWV